MIKKVIKNKKLADLEANDCRWPIGDPRDEDFHFCAGHKLNDGPYCEFHSTLAITSSNQHLRVATPKPLIKRAA